MKSIASAVGIIAFSGLLGGCAHTPGSDPFGAASRPIRVDILNRNFNDASVWAVYRAERVRLGTVTGKGDGSFQLPWRGAEPVYIEIDLVGGECCTTDALTVDEGDVLYLEIQLELSAMKECRSG
ncbi:MAG: hypothetical protein EXR95_05680 [Gemmatimonadetes bacterium]|nr:hypothetical protein [Gemmatimonadota bacterium]